MSSGSLRVVVTVTLLTIGLIFTSAGALAIWWGTNGTVINDLAFHIGATTPAEMINNGIILLSAGNSGLGNFCGAVYR